MYSHYLRINDDKGRQDFLLEEDCYALGRDRECSIRIHSRFASRHHAILRRCSGENQDYYYEIHDGDGKGNLSANGLFINGEKKKNHILQDGDKIVFGPEVFAIYYYRDLMNDSKSYKTINFLEYDNDTTAQIDETYAE